MAKRSATRPAPPPDVVPARTPRRRLSASRREELSFFAYISPWLIGFLLFSVVPMATSLYFSFHKITVLGLGRRSPVYVGFDNFVRIFTKDELFLQSIGNTFRFAAVRVFVGVALSLLVALLLNRKMPLRRTFRTMVYLTALIPIVGSAMLWQLLFSNDLSLFNYAIGLFGLPKVAWLDYGHAMSSVLVMSIWCGIGPTMTILLAALQGVPQDLHEAADIDGAGPGRRFFAVTIPMISPSLLFVVTTGLIGALQAFAEMKLLTGGGPGGATTTMTMLVVSNAFSDDGGLGMGYASAQAWVVFALTLVFTIVFFRVSGRYVYYAGEAKK
jgi:multiple sugar transport system permease protein